MHSRLPWRAWPATSGATTADPESSRSTRTRSAWRPSSQSGASPSAIAPVSPSTASTPPGPAIATPSEPVRVRTWRTERFAVSSPSPWRSWGSVAVAACSRARIDSSPGESTRGVESSRTAARSDALSATPSSTPMTRSIGASPGPSIVRRALD